MPRNRPSGRDGLPANCLFFYTAADRAKIEYFIEQKEPGPNREHTQWQLNQVIRYAHTTGCRTCYLLAYFGQEHPGQCGHCDNCVKPPHRVDATEDARRLLSTIARTEQRFGIGYVIDVLRGSMNDRIIRNRHDKLSVHGIGKHMPRGYWGVLADTLINLQHLSQRQEPYPVTQLTPTSKFVLRNQVQIEIVQSRAIAPRHQTRHIDTAKAATPIDQKLFEKLRTLRLHIRQQRVPPYVVFGDVSLRQMARDFPTTTDNFARVSGVGDTKFQRYGPRFMAAIDQYLSGQVTP